MRTTLLGQGCFVAIQPCWCCSCSINSDSALTNCEGQGLSHILQRGLILVEALDTLDGQILKIDLFSTVPFHSSEKRFVSTFSYL